MPNTTTGEKDFERFRKSGLLAGGSRAIGAFFVWARTAVAHGLVRLGVRPNHLTVAGFVITLFAAACFLVGAGQHAPYERPVPGVSASWWPLAAAFFLLLAGACDMLDGAVARQGRSGTPFGGVLDSTLDRLSDIAIYAGMAIHFAYYGNVTYTLLAVMAMCNGYMVSYVKARAEDLIDDCSVGYWLRGERCTGLLLACLCFHVPAWLWLQATAPLGTVARRLWHAYRELQGGAPPPGHSTGERQGMLRAIWQGDTPRGSIAYDLVTGVAIAFFVIAPWLWPFFYGGTDPLRTWLSRALPVG